MNPKILGFTVIRQWNGAIFLIALENRNLPIRPMHQVVEEGGLYRTGIKACRAEFVQQHITRFHRAKHVLPYLRDRALMRQQRTSSELEHDLADFGIVDPVVPFAQEPHAARHDDGGIFRHAFLAHSLAQRSDTRVWIFRLGRIFGVGQAVMSAGQPGIFIDHGCHEIGNLGVAALPQCPKGTGRGNDGQIVDVVTRRDFRKFIRHTCAASHAGDQSRAVFEHTFQNLLRTTHFPQHVDIDGALATGNFMGALHLFGRAVYGITNQLLEPLLTRRLRVNLGDRIAIVVVAVSIDCADSSNAASGCPCAGAQMVGCGNALATFDQWPDFLAAIAYRLQTLETH